MKLGLVTGYSGAEMTLNMKPILAAEELGFDSVWTAEAYGSDAIAPLAWIGAQPKDKARHRYHAECRRGLPP